jgi:hypothetical protein
VGRIASFLLHKIKANICVQKIDRGVGLRVPDAPVFLTHLRRV